MWLLKNLFTSKSNGHFQIKSPRSAWHLGSIHHSWPLSLLLYTTLWSPTSSSLSHSPLLASPSPLNLKVQWSLTFGSHLTLYSLPGWPYPGRWLPLTVSQKSSRGSKLSKFTNYIFFVYVSAFTKLNHIPQCSATYFSPQYYIMNILPCQYVIVNANTYVVITMLT